MKVADVLADLVAEQEQLDAVVAPLTADQWLLATPSPGWTIADQIGHLTYFDRTAALAITDTDAFVAHRDELMQHLVDAAAVDEATLGEFRRLTADGQLAAWRDARATLDAAGRTLDNGSRVEWYGPSMGAKSFLTARLMEVWAHGQDVVDALVRGGHDAQRPATDRLRHIAQLGFITRGWSYLVRGETPPRSEIFADLTAPSGERWRWGDADASQRITGSAMDFCLVATQRRHVDDTDLQIVGDDARDWMLKAQAFAGGPSQGPSPATETSHA